MTVGTTRIPPASTEVCTCGRAMTGGLTACCVDTTTAARYSVRRPFWAMRMSTS